METNPSGRDLGGSYDYEYDEAHDEPQPTAATPAPHPVDAPHLNLDKGGDYGYDEAHDFGG
jgi:hypothetical protein